MSRSRGTGSITRLEKKEKGRCREWKLRVKTPRGERTKRFHGTYSQAERELERFAEEVDRPSTDVTFAEYSARWVARRRAGDYALQTVEKDEANVRRLCVPLGDLALSDIDRRAAEMALAVVRNNGGGRPLAGSTMKGIYTTLNQVLKSARREELIERDPMEFVDCPRSDTAEKEALSLQETVRFLARLGSVPIDAHTVAVRIAVLAGLRRAEIVGLEWRDVRGDLLFVRRSIVERDGSVKTPKTSAGIRRVPMPAPLRSALDEWREAQREQLACIAARQTELTPVVTSSTGTRMRAQNLYRWWVGHRGEFGVSCNLHELRHSYLTILANSNAPAQVVKSVAGWASIEMANTYCHGDDAANRAAVKTFDDVLGSGSYGQQDI